MDNDIIIIYYTTWFKSLKYESYTTKENCDLYYSCYITHDKSLLNNTKTKAVIFHSSDIQHKYSDFPPNNKLAYNFPWILHSQESPINNFWELDEYKIKMFKYSMTYRLDSDFPVSYVPSNIIDKITDKHINLNNKRDDVYVSWVVSNSVAENKRHYYVKELQKYIKVDIYGNYLPYRNKKWPKDKTIYDIISTYKFYLSFENSNCDYYITEKLWNPLLTGTVPIVDGPTNYTLFSPSKHSLIKIDDYNNPKQLAEYLIYLSNNVTAYLEYFTYRSNIKMLDQSFLNVWNKSYGGSSEKWGYDETSGFCKMCKRIYESSHNIIDDTNKYLIPDQSCQRKKWNRYWISFYTSDLFLITWYIFISIFAIYILYKIKKSCRKYKKHLNYIELQNIR